MTQRPFWIRHALSLSAIVAAIGVFPGAGFGEGRSYTIDRVVIEGVKRIDAAAVKAQLHKTSGLISDDELSEDIKTLYKTGFFQQVSISVDAGDRSVLVVRVVEKPVIRKIFVKGNEDIKESELGDVFNLGTKRFYDKARLDAMGRAAVQFYQSRGYYDVAVSHSFAAGAQADQGDVTFTIAEGKKYKIAEIQFRGLTHVDPDDVRSQIETKRYKWWNSWLFGTGRLNKQMLENDKNLIAQYFLDQGYIDVMVSDPAVEKQGAGIVIVFDIKEGEQYKIGSITASGDLIHNSVKDTTEGISLSPGDVFSASKARADSFVISDKFGDIGFAFVNVTPRTTVDKDARTIGLDYVIAKGSKVSVRRVSIRGNSKTTDNVVRRDVKLAEKDIYSSSKIKRSETLLKRLGYFEEVTIGTEAVPGTADQVYLNVNVREASTGSFTVGAGYSSSNGAIFNSQISENNLFGSGRQLNLNVDIGSLQNLAILSLTDPRINDSFLSGGIDVQKATRNFLDFDRTMTGAGGSLGYPLEPLFGTWAQDIQSSMRYDHTQVNIRNIRSTAAQFVQQSAGYSTVSAITPQLSRNTIDNPLNPTKGVRQVLSVEVAGFGGDQKYFLVSALNQWFQPLFDLSNGSVVFSLRTRLDYGESSNGKPLPLFRRFFPGGINSVRGFRNRTMGPVDLQGNRYGGSKDFVNNAELIFPLIKAAGLNGVVFYDLGQAFDDKKSITFSELRGAYGRGIRWSSPMGPIRIEFGFPTEVKPGERSMVTLFSFGAPL